jgi:hypothetical protein
MPQEMISLEEAKKQVALACRRLGLLHLAFAEVLVEEMGAEEGKRVVARAIKEYGRMIGEKKREKALEGGLGLDPEGFKAVSDLPSLGMHGRIEETEVDGEERVRVHDCVMGRVWNEMGKGDLGRLYCMVDPANSMAFDPEHKLVHVKALPDGDGCCELVMRTTTEEDKAEFAADDTDWRIIEGGS